MRPPYIVGFHMKFPAAHEPNASGLALLIQIRIEIEKRKAKGLKLMNPVIRYGRNPYDFIENKFTVAVTMQAFKKPRFVKP